MEGTEWMEAEGFEGRRAATHEEQGTEGGGLRPPASWNCFENLQAFVFWVFNREGIIPFRILNSIALITVCRSPGTCFAGARD